MLEGDTLRLKVRANGLLEKCRFQQLLDNNIAVQFNQESEAVLHSIQEQKLIETPEPQVVGREGERGREGGRGRAGGREKEGRREGRMALHVFTVLIHVF